MPVFHSLDIDLLLLVTYVIIIVFFKTSSKYEIQVIPLSKYNAFKVTKFKYGLMHIGNLLM